MESSSSGGHTGFYLPWGILHPNLRNPWVQGGCWGCTPSSTTTSSPLAGHHPSPNHLCSPLDNCCTDYPRLVPFCLRVKNFTIMIYHECSFFNASIKYFFVGFYYLLEGNNLQILHPSLYHYAHSPHA